MINQRFQKEPERFPQWLQYMVVHFSGMRYASANGSWADPKDLMIRLSVRDVERELTPLDDTEIEKRCQEKIAIYESIDGTKKPKLALATEKEWTDKIQLDLAGIKASGPKTRRAGLLALFRRMSSGRGFVNDLRPTPDITAQIDQPTLVIATRSDGGVPFAQSLSLASSIRSAELVESHADSHMVWLGADWPVVGERIVAFLGGPS